MPPLSDAERRRKRRNEWIVASIVILIAAAIAGGIVWWKEKTSEELRSDGAYIPKPVTLTPEMELLREYVRIDTSTPAGAANGARWVAAQLQKRGIPAEIIESAPQRLNVYARIRGKQRGGGLLLFHHIDVVPPNGKWHSRPFGGDVAGDQMFGRGTLDMKALAICQLLAFADVAKGEIPAHDLVFLATADEESGSQYGMQWLLANRKDIFADVQYGVTEGGITEMVRERMTYFGIETGGKQLVELTLEGPDLDSLRRARFALEPYMFPREAERVLPEVARYFRVIAPTRMAYRPYLEDIERTIATGQFWRLPAPYRDLAQNALWAGAPAQNGARFVMPVKQANLPDENPDARIAWLAKIVAPFGVRVADVTTKQGPVPISTEQTPLFAILRDEATRRYSVPAGLQILYRSATDARFLRPHGIICYGVSPFRVDYFESLSIHSTDERIRLPWFQEGVAYMRSVVARWARGAD
ncbi:MAG: M20/M25/M40 family metallo-hydrolase [Acidobacteriota bacterium]|nr:M20/M25/M40 family metallo-hydrolase [Acidobacteriota bacterium]